MFPSYFIVSESEFLRMCAGLRRDAYPGMALLVISGADNSIYKSLFVSISGHVRS